MITDEYLNRARAALHEFPKDHEVLTNKYIHEIQVSNVGHVTNDSQFYSDELTDLCILVSLKCHAPNGVEVPTNYKGFRVFYKNKS